MNPAKPVSQLTASEKRRLLEELTKKNTAAPLSYPMSFSQQRLWFLDRLNPGNPFYNVESVAPIPGPFDVPALEKAINAIIERHAVLRTVFREMDGEPRQVVMPSLPIKLVVVDLSVLPKEQRESETERIVTEDAREPFDLANGPLIRAKILVLGYNHRLFVLRMHHIVADGWSMGIFSRELLAFYGKFAFGVAPDVPKLPIQYADYAVWQRKRLAGETMQKQLEYWRQQLDALEVLALPTDFRRPSVQSYRGAFHNVRFARRLTERIKALSREENCTLFMTLLAAFKLVLHRWSGQEDIVIGTYIANRQRAEVEHLIGFFLNTLVLRTPVCPADTFRHLMRKVRDMALGAYENQDLPFEMLVEKLQPDRDLSRNPLFQVTFQLSNTPTQASPTNPEQALDSKRGTAIFDIAFMLFEVPDGLAGQFEFSTDLFTPGTIQRLADQFGRLLEQVADDASKSISDYQLTSAQEKHDWLQRWNRPMTAVPAAGLPDLLRQCVAAHPDRPVYVTPERKLHYSELDRRSNQFARFLRARDVQEESVVGICMDRTVDLAIALWGIVKAGGAWLPLDPELPAERVELMLRTAGAGLVIADAPNEGRFTGMNVPVACAGQAWAQVDSYSAEALPSPLEMDRLAYVIFTSGSTGRPKGIAATHGQVLNRLWWMWREYPFEPNACGVFKTALSFVDSVWELFGYALRGVPCAFAPARAVRDPVALVDFMAEHRVTHFWFVPSLLRVLLDVPDLRLLLPELKFWVSSGEPLPLGLYERFVKSLPNAQLFNLYGTSEIWDATWCDPKGIDLSSGYVPIGRPITNVEAYILDAKAHLVPPGFPGELCIGGAGLARGYLGDPELTLNRFAEVELAPGVRRRLYRTGDRARLRGDGHIELLERMDHQVKLRGYRIELAEIEGALCAHEGVALAAARALEIQGDKRIVAWFTTRNGAVDPAALRSFLERRLPSYMVPWRCVALPAMPLTTSGKINRKALVLTLESLDEPVGQAPPHGRLEELIAAIWSDVLGGVPVGRDANFFGDLGGHSLIATQAVSRLRDTLQHDVPLRLMFEHMTLASLAQALRSQPGGEQLEDAAELVLEIDREGAGQHPGHRFRLTPEQRQRVRERTQQAPPARPEPGHVSAPPAGTRIPLSSPQRRLWFIEQMLPPGQSVAIETLTPVLGRLPASLLLRAVRHIVNRHEILRASFHVEGGVPHLQIQDTVPLELPEIDLRQRSPDERAAAKAAEMEVCRREGFDLARAPLIKLRLFRLSETEGELFLRIHHAVTDGWSMGLFAQELRDVLAALARDREPDLPPLAAQYKDFIQWQQEEITGERLQQQLQYWRGKLQGLGVLPLPTDRPRPARVTFNGAHARFHVPAVVYTRVESLAAGQGCTPFMVLLAAFKVLLSARCGAPDVAVGTYVSFRLRQEFEALIGLFLNLLVLRTSFDDARRFTEALGRVRETSLGAFAHQAMPFEELVKELRVPRDPSRNPLVQVLFQLNNAFGQTGTLEEVNAAFGVFDGVAPFDISFMGSPTPQGLACLLEYNTDLFDRQTMEQLGSEYIRVLETIIQDPEVELTSLPVTRGAPVSDRALHPPVPTSARPGPARPVDLAVLNRIAEIWRTILDCGEVSETANFFELGGHSLLAVQVIARLKDALHVELPLNLLFDFSVLRDLAAEVSARLAQSAPREHLHIPRLSRDQFRRRGPA